MNKDHVETDDNTCPLCDRKFENRSALLKLFESEHVKSRQKDSQNYQKMSMFGGRVRCVAACSGDRRPASFM